MRLSNALNPCIINSMSSKESLIRQLYESTRKDTTPQPGKRLVETTNTLMDHEVTGSDAPPLGSELPEIAVEVDEYRKISSGKKRMKSVRMQYSGYLKEIRLVEVSSFVPTGNTTLIPVVEVLRGDGKNGIMEGYMVITFGMNTW